MTQSQTNSCVIIGEGSLVIQCAENWLKRGQQILAVVSNEVSIQQWASGHGLLHVSPDTNYQVTLRQQPFDYLFSIVNLKMLPDDVLKLPLKAAINFHDGPLPEYAGINVTMWALLNGETSHGVTWHEMTSEADKGRILKQKLFDVAPTETSFSLNAKCFSAGIDSFAELADDIVQNRLSPVVQDFSTRAYFGKYQRPEAACTVPWKQDGEAVIRFIKALDFGGGYANPVGLPKLRVGARLLVVADAELTERKSTTAPGTLHWDGQHADVATNTFDVRLTSLRNLNGASVTPAQLQEIPTWRSGMVFDFPDDAQKAKLNELTTRAAKSEEGWAKEMSEFTAPQIPGVVTTQNKSDTFFTLTCSWGAFAGVALVDKLAALAQFVARFSGDYVFQLGLELPAFRDGVAGAEAYFISDIPWRVKLDPEHGFAKNQTTLKQSLERCEKRGPVARDFLARHPSLTNLAELDGAVNFGVRIRVGGAAPAALPAGTLIQWQVSETHQELSLCVANEALDKQGAQALVDRLAAFLSAAHFQPDVPLSRVSLLSDSERQRVLVDFNRTAQNVPKDVCVHDLIARQAARTPDAVAVVCRGQIISYRELNARANQLARHLQSLGVGVESLVGVYLERSIEMMVAILGIQKAGAAYVPLDPAYPADRIALMIDDSQLPVVIVQERLRGRLPSDKARVVAIDAEWQNAIAKHADTDLQTPVRPHHRCYVIYTSGSTGKPKGAEIEHRNVVNFFEGMDQRLGFEKPGTWLAVTSLNFDISVLELFWTLSRGFTVVLFVEEARTAVSQRSQHLDFGLFYFASDEGTSGPEAYDLLLEGARFADEHGFNSVWTPERHFHAFGGLFPNPAVTSAALATVTKKVALRSGSCVSPLHSSVRIAEEWSVVDNLSRGRAGLSFASGWQPNDFVIKPENFSNRKNIMFEQIDVVRRLWRGEAVNFKGPTGKDVPIKILPKPVQKELPIWVTTAGNPETFEQAGKHGANLLTHLLGQTFAEVSEKIAVYRKAWAAAGHPGRGVVTLMLHTFVGESDESVKETVREPMKAYLRSAVGLVKEAAWSFPTFKQKTTLADGNFSMDHLSEADMDALLNHSFERYYGSSGLFGSVETCTKIAEQCRQIDVDEVGCLVDFGVPQRKVLQHLNLLVRVMQNVNASQPAIAPPPDTTGDFSIGALLKQHQVTHFQCTPSMAGMLMLDPQARQNLSSLQKMMVGGEAFPIPLARELRKIVKGDIINMYGPTETTIWSTTFALKEVGDAIPIGTPIANTDVLILDQNLQLVPIGSPGELCIGGSGVVRGYLNRPELTAQRFVPHPFRSEPGARLYRTGDLARFRADGVVEFLGRIDHQVKIRGFRIELGEIESAIATFAGVREVVVVAREDVPGDKRLVAYFIPHAGKNPDSSEMREFLKKRLPEYMVPAAFVSMTSFPQTPNRKIDRKALPPPERVAAASNTAYVQPSSDVETLIAQIWQEILSVPKVGVDDNFFDLGGHSLLSVQVLMRLKEKVDKPVSLVDMFRFPTVRSLARYLGADESANEALKQSAARGEARKEALDRRLAMQQRRRRGA